MANFSTGYGVAVDRVDADQLIPDEISKEIFKEATGGSQVLGRLRRLADMPSKVRTMPVLNLLPTAYFPNAEADDEDPNAYHGLHKATKIAWTNKKITAEDLGVIVPIPNNVVDDMAGNGFDAWGEIQPTIAEAIAVAVDQAILFGTSKPTGWPNGILPDATTYGKVVTEGTGADLYEDILGENGLFDMINQSGYAVSSCLGAIEMQGKLRSVRSRDGVPIFNPTPGKVGSYDLWGVPSTFPDTGVMDATSALLIAGAWNKAVFAWRKGISITMATEGVIQDSSGVIQYNLFQQDMTAMKVTCRLGWQLPNPINRVDGTANRYPFGALIPAA